MTMTNAGTHSATGVIGTEIERTARTTGLLYLGFFVTGIAGSLVLRARLFAADDPQGTLSNLVRARVAGPRRHRTGAVHRAGPGPDSGVVLPPVPQRRHVARLASLAVFGMVNAVAILGSAAILATALDVAGDASLAVTGSSAATVQLLYVASGHLWGVAAVFFGLWLVPMGWLVLRSRWLPLPLGWTLIGAALGYLVSAFVSYLFPNADVVTQLLTVPATIGEIWIMGYLIIVGVRHHAPASDVAHGAVRAP